MTVERRFLTGYELKSTDEPGLVFGEDGTIWIVAPDGTRTQIEGGGGGGSLPDEWTVGAGGQLVIAPDTLTAPYLELDAPAGAFGTALRIKDENDEPVFEVQAESGTDIYAQAANIAALDVHSVADADDGNPVFRVRPDLNGGHATVFEVDSNGACRVTSRDAFAIPMLLFGFTGQVLPLLEIQDSNGNKLFQVRPDGSLHIKTGATLVADL